MSINYMLDIGADREYRTGMTEKRCTFTTLSFEKRLLTYLRKGVDMPDYRFAERSGHAVGALRAVMIRTGETPQEICDRLEIPTEQWSVLQKAIGPPLTKELLLSKKNPKHIVRACPHCGGPLD